MRSAARQHPGPSKWTIGRLMAVVAMLAVPMAAMRGAGLGAVLSVLVPMGVVFGFLKDRSLGGPGPFGAIIGGVLAVAATSAVSFLTLLRQGAYALTPDAVRLGPILGGIALLLVVGTVVLASRLAPVPGRTPGPPADAPTAPGPPRLGPDGRHRG